jgi:hypothetical protein
MNSKSKIKAISPLNQITPSSTVNTKISNNSFRTSKPVNNGVFKDFANNFVRYLNPGVYGSGGFNSNQGFGQSNFNPRSFTSSGFGNNMIPNIKNSVIENLNRISRNTGITSFNQQNPNSMQYNDINKNAFSNMSNIQGMMGEAINGTFNRQVGKSPLRQSIDPLTGQYLDPTMDPTTDTTVIPPPTGVETQITPNYNINNY